jgi:hypothetical protein
MKSIISGLRNRTAGFLLGKLGVERPFSLETASLTPGEYEGLGQLVSEALSEEGPIIEVGTLIGMTTIRLALFAPERQVITVDNYCWNAWGFLPSEHQALAEHGLRALIEMGRVKQVCMDKDEFYRTYDGPTPAMVFLDAMHSYEETKKDIEWARAIGAHLITGHDYKQEWPGVIQAVEEAGGARRQFESVWSL